MKLKLSGSERSYVNRYVPIFCSLTVLAVLGALAYGFDSLASKSAGLALLILPGYLLTYIFGFHAESGIVELIVISVGSSVGIAIAIVTALGLLAMQESTTAFLFPYVVISIASIFKSIYRNLKPRNDTGNLVKRRSLLLKGEAIRKRINMETVVVIVAIAVLLIGGYFLIFETIVDSDSYSYLFAAKAVSTDLWGSIDLSRIVIKTPLYYWNDYVNDYYQPGVIMDRTELVFMYGFYTRIVGAETSSGQLLATFFHSMLILSTFLLGTLISKRVAFHSALLVVANPILWWYSNRFLSDVPLAFFASASLYFFFQSQGIKGTNRSATKIWILFFVISIGIKGEALLWFFPLFLYWIGRIVRRALRPNVEAFREFLILSFLALLSVIFVNHVRYAGSFRSIISDMIIVPFEYISGTSAFWANLFNLLNPMYFPLPVFVLVVVGIISSIFVIPKKMNALFGLCWMIPLWSVMTLAGGALTRAGARVLFLTFPIICVYGALAFELILQVGRSRSSRDPLNFKAVFILPYVLGGLLVWLFFNLKTQTASPYTEVIPEIFLSSADVAIFLGLAITILLVLCVSAHMLLLFTLKRGNLTKRLNNMIRPLGYSLVMIIILVSGSYSTVLFFRNGAWTNISPAEIGVTHVAHWINEHAPFNASILTQPILAAPMHYYTSRPTFVPPKNLSIFTDMIHTRRIKYIALFSPDNPRFLGYLPNYMTLFFWEPPNGTTEVYRLTLNDSWTDTFLGNSPSPQWKQLFPGHQAIVEDGLLLLGGQHGDSGLKTDSIYLPFLLNITARMYATQNATNTPLIVWSEEGQGTFIHAGYYEGGWRITWGVHGEMTASAFASAILYPQTLHTLSLLLRGNKAYLYVDGRLATSLTWSPPAIQGRVSIQSSYFSPGVVDYFELHSETTLAVVYEVR